MFKIILPLAAILFTGQSFSANESNLAVLKQAAELRDKALAHSRPYQIVESLTVEVGARFPGSESDQRAVAWAVEKLKQFNFDKVYLETVDIPRWNRGHAHAEIISPYPHHLVVTALGGSVATPKQGIVAEVVRFSSLEALEQAPADSLVGKIAFIDKKTPRLKDGAGYGQTSKIRRKSASVAATKGADAVVIRSIGTDSDRMPHTGQMAYLPNIKKIPIGALSAPDANLLATMLSKTDSVTLKLNLGSMPINPGTTSNVIAEITGREKPEEVIILGAHLDSWDLGTGALDDGAGVAIVSEAARLIAALPHRPKRTIRLVLWAAEEIGLVGSKQYVARHKAELKDIRLVSESDFGGRNIYRFDSNFAATDSHFTTTVMKVLAPLGIKKGNNDAGGGPDSWPFRSQGVPVFSLRQDGTDYFDYHHTPNDTLDKLDAKELQQNVAAWVSVIYLAAESDAEFSHLPVNKK